MAENETEKASHDCVVIEQLREVLEEHAEGTGHYDLDGNFIRGWQACARSIRLNLSQIEQQSKASENDGAAGSR